MKIIDKFHEWIIGPAEWWEFWKPQSGVVGGLAAGLVFVILMVLVLINFYS